MEKNKNEAYIFIIQESIGVLRFKSLTFNKRLYFEIEIYSNQKLFSPENDGQTKPI